MKAHLKEGCRKQGGKETLCDEGPQCCHGVTEMGNKLRRAFEVTWYFLTLLRLKS